MKTFIKNSYLLPSLFWKISKHQLSEFPMETFIKKIHIESTYDNPYTYIYSILMTHLSSVKLIINPYIFFIFLPLPFLFFLHYHRGNPDLDLSGFFPFYFVERIISHRHPLLIIYHASPSLISCSLEVIDCRCNTRFP